MIFNSGVGFLGPAFDVNDLGFGSYSDIANAHIGGGYKWTTPGRWKRYQNLLISFFGSTDMHGVITNAGVWGSGYTEFNNNYQFEYDEDRAILIDALKNYGVHAYVVSDTHLTFDRR